MKTILKIILALSLVSSVAFGAKVYKYNYDQNSRDEYIEKDIKIKDYKELVEFAKDCNLKLEYGKDENNVERIIVVMKNGEKVILEHLSEGTDADGVYFTLESDLWVKKDGVRGIIDGSKCPMFNKEELKVYIPEVEEDDYLEYLQYKRELKTDDDNATDEHSEIRNWFINNANGLHEKVNEESKK